ncbi:protein translocase subunit SecD [Candidatus Dependentiae bacterium]|nr:protein translocase subunit SecD [Candidatus Dependentiae bacterium]
MTLTSRPLLLLNCLLWLGITLFGAYFLVHLFNPTKDERGFINFGIDLVGGTYLTLEVKIDEAVKNDLLAFMVDVNDRVRKDGVQPTAAPIIEEPLKGILAFSSDADATKALKIYETAAADAVGMVPQVTQSGKNLVFIYSKENLQEAKREAIAGTIAILRTRLDAFGAGEVAIVPQGERMIGIELPNVSDPGKAKARIGTAAILELKPVYDMARTQEELIERAGGTISEGTMIIPGKQKDPYFYLVPTYAKVTGKMLKSAGYKFNEQPFSQQSPHFVALAFKREGAAKFEALTRENLGNQVAIILDNIVVTAPRVNEVISSASAQAGQVTISGDYDRESAEELVTLLKSGAFSAPVEFAEERHIGPSLGKESIRQGFMSCGIALVLLFLFSVFVYKTAGLLAFVVLLFNLLFILFGLALVPDATLTLPGIAGMILTVGMAIDSSILIYERVKEELSLGSSFPKAIDTGFNGALTVILDANITTFIVGAVLYYLGSPAIQGFALTMMIGIIATLITGLVLLKTIYNLLFALGVKSVAI